MKWEEAKTEKGEKGKGGKKRGCLLVIVALVVIGVVGGLLSRCGGGGSDRLEWPSTGLATMLPKPNSDKGAVRDNSDDSFRADVNGCSASDYEAYVAACQEMGYTVEAVSDTNDYEAYSEDGYFLELSYRESAEEMSISLEAPIEMGALTWPTSGVGALAPAPASTTGKIDSDSSGFFYAYVGETSAEDYAAYVDACMAAGFDVDYSRGDTSFGLFDIPFTDNSFWYRYEGTIKAGVNLQTAAIEDNGDSVTITLDPAYIIANTPDMNESGVLEERNNVLNPIQVGDVDEFQRWCIEQSQTEAVEGGLLMEARLQAETQLTQLFYAALGDEVTISFVWRDAPVESAE